MSNKELPILKTIPEKVLSGIDLYRFNKRLLDIVLCLILLPILLPIMVVIAIFIILETPGSPLFIQERIGKDGKRFTLYKFRTMENNHNSDQERQYMKDYVTGKVIIPVTGESFKPATKSLTKVGSVLRKTSLDELPQIFNVILGEMSLIGPRPNVPWEVDEYLDWHRERLSVLPGITGLAQVKGRSNITFDEIVRYDIYYARNANLKLDAHILWQTISVVFRGWGAG